MTETDDPDETGMTAAGGFSRRAVLGGSSLIAAAALPARDVLTGPTHVPGVTLASGTHVIASNTVIKGDVTMLPGATIEVADGKTLTILGDFQAPGSKVFVGPGIVDLTRSRALFARPEWWGAVPDDPAADCLPALSACLRAHHEMRLLPADYHIADTWVVDLPSRRIWGSGARSPGGNQGARIIVKSGDRDVIRVGPSEAPGSVNAFLQNIDIRWIGLARSEPVVAERDDACAGLRVQFVLFGHFEGLSASEHACGFVVKGAVRTYLRDCVAFRSLEGTRPGQDGYRGFVLDGRADIGLAGGNASIYVIDCNASLGGSPCLSSAVGFSMPGAFSDTFLINCETSQIPVGMQALGNAQNDGAGRQRTGYANLHIHMPVLDQCSKVGIEIKHSGDYGMIDVRDPYIALGHGGLAAIFLDAVGGLMSISGGQLIGLPDSTTGGNGLGFYALNCDGFELSGTKIMSFKRPVGLVDCRNFTLSPAINNPRESASQGAVWMRNCHRGRIRATVKGGDGVFPAILTAIGSADVDARSLIFDSASVVNDGPPHQLIASQVEL